MIVTVARSAAGQAQHVVVNHRPRSSVLLLTSLCAEKFGGTPLGSLFVDGEPDLRASVGATYTLTASTGPPTTTPQWLDELADDVTLEGAAMNGTARGAETVRSVVLYARTLYEHQVFSFTGPYGDNGFLEQYTTPIKRDATGVVVRGTRNAAGEAQHVAGRRLLALARAQHTQSPPQLVRFAQQVVQLVLKIVSYLIKHGVFVRWLLLTQSYDTRMSELLAKR